MDLAQDMALRSIIARLPKVRRITFCLFVGIALHLSVFSAVAQENIPAEETVFPEAAELEADLPENYDAPWDNDASAGSSGQFDPAMLALLPVLRMGIVLEAAEDPDRSGFRSIEPFRASLEAEMGIPVDLVAYGSLNGVRDALLSGEIHYAQLSASAFAEGFKRCSCIEPLAVPLASDGSHAFHSVVIVRRASPYEKLTDLKGARIAVSTPTSTAGRRIPFHAFRKQGIDPQEFFAEIIETDGPISAAKLVMTGAADASLGWSSLVGEERAGYTRGTMADLVGRKIMEPGSLRIMWASEPIPHGPHTVRSDVPAEIRRRLRQFLLAERERAPAAGEGALLAVGSFAPIESSSYRPILDSFPESPNVSQPSRGSLTDLSVK